MVTFLGMAVLWADARPLTVKRIPQNERYLDEVSTEERKDYEGTEKANSR